MPCFGGLCPFGSECSNSRRAMGRYGVCRIAMPKDEVLFRAWVGSMPWPPGQKPADTYVGELFERHAPRSLQHRGGTQSKQSANKNQLFIGINHFYAENVELKGGDSRPRVALRKVDQHPEVSATRAVRSPLPARPLAGRDGTLGARPAARAAAILSGWKPGDSPASGARAARVQARSP